MEVVSLPHTSLVQNINVLEVRAFNIKVLECICVRITAPQKAQWCPVQYYTPTQGHRVQFLM